MSRRAAALLLAVLFTGCAGPNASPDTAQTHVCIATNTDGPAPHTFNQLAIDGARGAGAGGGRADKQQVAQMIRVLLCLADAPVFGHGEMSEKPRPDPSKMRTIDDAAAVTAPPNMAAQEMAETDDSAATRESVG